MQRARCRPPRQSNNSQPKRAIDDSPAWNISSHLVLRIIRSLESAMAKSRKLFLEFLEDRITPTSWGIAWPNPGHLTLSFVPDGSGVSNAQSALFQNLNTNAPASAWQTEILRALQTWAI